MQMVPMHQHHMVRLYAFLQVSQVSPVPKSYLHPFLCRPAQSWPQCYHDWAYFNAD